MPGNILYQTSISIKYIQKTTFCLWNHWHKLFLLFQKEQSASHKTAIDRDVINQKAEELMSEYGNSILRLSYSYVHNMSDAEDILQDTLVKFLKTEPTFENKNHEKAWLLQVASNLSKNRIRYNKLRNTDELNESLIAENREDLSFIWDAVKVLPPKYREVIHLFYQEGYSTDEISHILHQNESTVRSHLHRGRLKLKEQLKEAYDFEDTI